MTKYLMCILIIIGMTMAVSCVVVSFIYGEFVFAMIFIALLAFLAREMHVETNRVSQFD